MKPPGLTIGQLAAHAGVTVRAIRHYHRCGLLAEPDRDVSGYRRYSAQAVVDLIRIKTLAGAGVPLARISRLLTAGPEEFAAAIAQIDSALKQKIRELTAHRRAIAELAAGERLFLPAEVADLLGQLRELGVSERSVRTERDGWILVAALSPQLLSEWVDQKLTALADPEFRALYLACDQAHDWDPADPRLAEVADRVAAWSARGQPDTAQRPADQPPTDEPPADLPPALALLATHIASASPGWQHLSNLARDRLQARNR